MQGVSVSVQSTPKGDYISITDMARRFGDENLIYSWMRNRNTVEFMGIWEQLHNPSFKGGEFETFRKSSGLNSFHLTPRKWIDATAAIGIRSQAGRYGGTYAHADIAFEFGSWLSPEFKLYLIKEFQRLKAEESRRLSLDWDLHRTLAKINYRIHTDAIKTHLIPRQLGSDQTIATYASEADVLNVALFGMTAKEWREQNLVSEGNMRDYASIDQLLVLANLESINSVFIRNDVSQQQRLIELNAIAISQMTALSKTRLVLPGNSASKNSSNTFR